MSHILNPDLFQGYCLAAVTFELPVIVQLLRGDWRLPDAGSWFDEEPRYTNNPALTYVFVTLLFVLVIGRAMAFFLPNLRMVIVYNIVLHTLEAATFFYCFMKKEDPSNASAYAIGALMLASVGVFTTRLLYLKGHQQAAAVAEMEWRKEQLAIIRQKRAEYAKAKMAKKQD